jgi:hypothetical protein
MRACPISDVSGFVSGFWLSKSKPDKRLPSAIKQLYINCRVCRVYLGGETSREITNSGVPGRLAHNALIRLDLNDVAD